MRSLQQRQEKDALALDHEQRKLAEEFARGTVAVVGGAAGTGALAAGRRPGAGTAGARSAVAGREGSGPLDRRTGAGAIARRFRGIAGARAPVRRGARERCARNWRGSRSASDPSAPRRRGLKLQIAAASARKRRSRPRWSGWAWSGRGCLPTTSNWIDAPGELVEAMSRPRTSCSELAAQETTQRANLAALDEALKQLRIECRRRRRRSAAQIELELVQQAGRAEVSGRNQPQGTERAARKSWPRAKRPCWTRPGWPKPSRSTRK